MQNSYTYSGKVRTIGWVSVVVKSAGVQSISFDKSRKRGTRPFNSRIKKWLKNYECGRAGKFPYRLILRGTDFQKDVWRAIQKIPYGQTRTYSWIARKIGRPRAARAVGTACGANPFPIVIPCHRVVASNGLGGFSAGLLLKKKLLKIEFNRRG